MMTYESAMNGAYDGNAAKSIQLSSGRNLLVSSCFVNPNPEDCSMSVYGYYQVEMCSLEYSELQ